MKRIKEVKKINLHVAMAISTIITLICAGAVFYHINEHLSWMDSFYFTVMTVITVGYNDFKPTNDISKLFTMAYVLISVPTLLFYLGLIVEDQFESRIQRVEERYEERHKNN